MTTLKRQYFFFFFFPAITVIANLVTNLPRPASGEIAWEVAVIAVNNLVDAFDSHCRR